MERVLIVIPARYQSQRFHGKVLVDILGKPMIQRVWERASASSLTDDVIIATDDEQVFQTAQGFGAKVMMTSSHHRSGTERVAEVAEKLEFEIIINVQGDEPLISPQAIDQLIEIMRDDDSVQMASLRVEIKTYDDYIDPTVVKVVCDDQDWALYFSRNPLPHYRGKEAEIEEWKKSGARPRELNPPPYKHLGIYGYRKDFLSAFSRLPQSGLELAERLEQLRALAWGFRIKVPETQFDSISVDVPADLEKVIKILKEEEKNES